MAISLATGNWKLAHIRNKNLDFGATQYLCCKSAVNVGVELCMNNKKKRSYKCKEISREREEV
jgi:hypothetical protein